MEFISTARKDSKTKILVKRLRPGEIGVVDHPDLDLIAAESLVKSQIRLLVNASASISGRYPNAGPQLLLEAGIPILDLVGKECFDSIIDGTKITVKDTRLFYQDTLIGEGELLTALRVKELTERARENLHLELASFVQNTLDYALKEKELILGRLPLPDLTVNIKDRHVLVVVRGQNYFQDLRTIYSYIKEVHPVLIGVDGGADALLAAGFKPEIIIGDMDSVSDEALLSGAELVVHAYPDGNAPGSERLQKLNLEAKVFPAPGTSEDIALLLAYEKGAKLIVAVGAHSNMIDFLDKGRKGMASTFLVRLKVGASLVDARGVSLLYKSRLQSEQLLLIGLAASIPLTAVLTRDNLIRDLIRLLWLRLRVMVGI